MSFAKLSERKGFWGVEFSDFQGSLQLLTSSHLRERDKMLLKAVLCGGVWNGFLLGKAKKEDVPCRFCGKRDGDGHFFWECTSSPLSPSMSGIFLSLLLLCSLTAATGPVVCFGLGLPLLVIWRLSILRGASVLILLTLLIVGLLLTIGMLTILPWNCLNILMSGLMGFEVAGAGVYLPASELAFENLVWGTVEEYGDARLERCPAFLPVPGVMQTVQRAEFWCAILAMQAYWPCHLGIDNPNVAWSIGRLFGHDSLVKPLPLVKDGDLIALVQYMIRTRGRETVRVTKVKGHADDVDVRQGRVRLLDQQENVEADIAADLGRRHQSEMLIDARRRLLQARSYWYPIMLDLHRFMIAAARVSVNHDGKGGTATDPLVWDQGSRPKVRKLAIRVTVDLASLPGPSGFLNSSWVQVDSGRITGADIAAWPYSVGIFIRFTSFLATLHWPSGSVDFGHFGLPFMELLILFEQWAGHWLLSEKVTRPHVRANRPILLPSVPVSEGIEIRHGCQCVSSLIRALAKLPGGLGRFLPCGLGSHMSRLRHLGWNQCSHGLTSRPLESSHHQCLKAVCGVLAYPKGSALELLNGTLKLRHCTDVFTMRFPHWSLPRVGIMGGKRQSITPGYFLEAGSNVGKKGPAYYEDTSR